MQTLIRERAKELYSEDNYAKIMTAFEFAQRAHNGQKRQSGEDYFVHPCSVANILIDLGMDYETIIAALLHDVLEDTGVTADEMKNMFGDSVLKLVEGVTKINKLKFKTKEDEQAENLRKMLLAMSYDIRIIIIKLADRLHNMRTLEFKEEASRQRISKETLEIYAPIAARLGIGQIKGELEDLSFMYLYSKEYGEIVDKVTEVLKDRQRFIEIVMSEIEDKLGELGIKGEVNGRQKHYYSIFKKMNKGKTFDQIYDLIAVRIIVGTVRDCYELLGEIHTMWKPLPGRFKDYIAMPKNNMYQSLHTTVLSPLGNAPFEVQIRTYEMHKQAEYGIAAHWKYKEGKTKSAQSEIDNKLAWLRQVMEVQKEFNDSSEFLDSLKLDLYHDEVFVFTPKGDVINLPQGSTGVDLAYAIHSAVGNKCVGIKIDSKIVPLNTELETGNIVEVITSNASKGPSRDWLKFVKTPSARSKIRQFFKREMRDENLQRGKDMLEKEAKHRGYNLGDLISNDNWKKYIQSRYNISNIDDVYVNVGCGVFTTNQVIVRLIDCFKTDIGAKETVLEIKTPSPVTAGRDKKKQKDSGILIKGYDDFLIRLSHCCKPVPGDKIVGYISRGRGVSIHRADCPNLKSIEPSRLIEAQWPERVNQKFSAELNIIGENEIGFVSKVTALLAGMHMNMNSMNARVDDNGSAVITVSVDISNTDDLEFLMKKLKSLSVVQDVFRTQSK